MRSLTLGAQHFSGAQLGPETNFDTYEHRSGEERSLELRSQYRSLRA